MRSESDCSHLSRPSTTATTRSHNFSTPLTRSGRRGQSSTLAEASRDQPCTGSCSPTRHVACPSWLRAYGGRSKVHRQRCVALLWALVFLRLHPGLTAACVILPLIGLYLA
jgi:hypothetical protein